MVVSPASPIPTLMLIVEGGPGISGVGHLFQVGSQLSQYVGGEYNLVGFDPRAINNSGPSVDCFSKNPDAQIAYQNLFYNDTSNASSASLETQFYVADIFGESCSYSISQNRSQMYISTLLVAQDMLTYAKAEQNAAGKSESDAKLWYFGQSYGTVLGATFASLFPNNVGWLVLDGVVDAEDYYHNGWRTNLYQTNEAVYSFSATCYQSGPQNCSFWGPSPKNITHRINNILADLKHRPVPKTGLSNQYTPGLATYSDLKQLMLLAVYFPLSGFPLLSDILASIESDNSSAFMGASDLVSGFLVSDDASVMIKCIDAYGRSNYSTIEDYRAYVKLLEHQSHYLGEAWPVNADGVLCRSVDLQVPKSITFQGMPNAFHFRVKNALTLFSGPLPPSSNQTSFPLLFVSNTIDPAAPIIG
jgi:pimeloyl-ACP methyl ester carboxylesterase